MVSSLRRGVWETWLRPVRGAQAVANPTGDFGGGEEDNECREPRRAGGTITMSREGVRMERVHGLCQGDRVHAASSPLVSVRSHSHLALTRRLSSMDLNSFVKVCLSRFADLKNSSLLLTRYS
jgi:hypothetical protein